MTMLEMLKEYYKEKCETPGVAVPFGGQSPIFPKVVVVRELGEIVLYRTQGKNKKIFEKLS